MNVVHAVADDDVGLPGPVECLASRSTLVVAVLRHEHEVAQSLFLSGAKRRGERSNPTAAAPSTVTT